MRRPELAAAGAGLSVAAAAAFLLVQLAPDVRSKPLYEDEALAGLIAARPLPELFDTVMWDRGGAPLHFLLAHVTLALDPTPDALRWLSVVFALATVGVCYDLGRRLSGRVAGVTAAVVVATAELLTVYGSFGRMYSLFAFVSAVALDLFVRALRGRTAEAAAAAALGAWLVPAVHPYGVMLVAAEAAVALAVWRGRSLRAFLPVGAIALAAVPLLLADLRLAERFSVGVEGEVNLLPPERALNHLTRGLQAFAGGAALTFPVFLGLALAGLVVLVRREPAFALLAGLALVVPPALLILGKAGGGLVTTHLSIRHLVFLLPLWAALIGVGAARAAGNLPRLQALAVLTVAALAVFSPSGVVHDPRTLSSGRPAALAAPSSWLEERVAEGDAVFPYSPVYLSALAATRHAAVLTRADAALLLREAERLEPPVRAVFVAVPLDEARVDGERLQAQLGDGYGVHLFRLWLLIEARGPFPDGGAVVEAARRAVVATGEATRSRSPRFLGYVRLSQVTLGRSLCRLAEPSCPFRAA